MDWQKSSFSNPTGNSIEVAHSGENVMLHESDDPGRTVTTTPAKFKAFIDGVKAGEFDHFTG